MTLEERIGQLEKQVEGLLNGPMASLTALWAAAHQDQWVTTREALAWFQSDPGACLWLGQRLPAPWTINALARFLSGTMLTGTSYHNQKRWRLREVDVRDPPMVRQLGTNHAIDLSAWNELRVQDQRGQHPPSRTITLTASGPPGAGKTHLLARIAEVLGAEYKFTRPDAQPNELVVSWTREEADHG